MSHVQLLTNVARFDDRRREASRRRYLETVTRPPRSARRPVAFPRPRLNFGSATADR